MAPATVLQLKNPGDNRYRPARRDGPAIFRFGIWEVQSMTRELLRQGVVQALEPRAFDFLMYLLLHRDRVVSKDELLDEVWRGEYFSVSVIARAALKVRQALGEGGMASEVIKTVHRNGYRFAGRLLAFDEPAAPVDTSPERGSPAISMVLLPFENCTSREDLNWIELGLMSVTARALGQEPRIKVLPISSVLSTVETLPTDMDARQRGSIALARLEASQVVQTSIGHDGTRFWLDYCIGTENAWGSTHRLTGMDLPGLAHLLAGALTEDLCPEGLVAPLHDIQLADPFAIRVWLRALQAAEQESWHTAINLFKVVLDIQPDNVAVQIEYLRSIVQSGDSSATAVAEKLLTASTGRRNTVLAP